MFDIITIGSATKDNFLKIPSLVFYNDKKKFITGKGICFSLGAKITALEFKTFSGGSATNTALTFSRQGLKTAAIFRIGNDFFGKELIEEAEKEKIETEFVQKDKNLPTAQSIIFLTPKGERTIVSYKGAGEYLSFDGIVKGGLKTKWLFLGSLGKEKNILTKIIKYAAENHIFLATNPGAREIAFLKDNPGWLNKFRIFICNQEEASYLTDISFHQEKKIFQKLDDLIKGVVVMTKGDRGVSVSDGHYLWQAEAFRLGKVKDKTGAGDAFASAFVSVFVKAGEISENLIKEAIQLAIFNSGSVVSQLGAKAGVMKKTDFKKNDFQKIKVNKKLL